MPVILHGLPFYERPTSVSVHGETVRIKPYQIILWASIGPAGERELRQNVPRFPAILDIGHSHNFSITEDHLTRWSGLDPRFANAVGAVRVAGQRLPLIDAYVWLHPNQRGQRDEFTQRPPFCIELDSGIALYPHVAASVPRLPLLGLRGLRRAELQLHVDCRKCLVSLSTPRRFWLF
jgi:hypothetical protein